MDGRQQVSDGDQPDDFGRGFDLHFDVPELLEHVFELLLHNLAEVLREPGGVPDNEISDKVFLLSENRQDILGDFVVFADDEALHELEREDRGLEGLRGFLYEGEQVGGAELGELRVRHFLEP